MLFLASLAFLLFAQAINGQVPTHNPLNLTSSTTSTTSTTSSTSITSSTSTTSSTPTTTTTTTPVPIPFIIPTSTATLPISVSTTPPASTATPFLVANPANPGESAAFAVGQVPPEQRDRLPDATDAAPAALLLLGFAFPVLMFSNFEFVYAIGAAPAWLALGLFPSVAQIHSSEGPGNPKPTTGEPSPTTTPTTTRTSTTSTSTSSTSRTSTGSVSTITTSMEVDISSIIGEYGGNATVFTFLEQIPGDQIGSMTGSPTSIPPSSTTSSTSTVTSSPESTPPTTTPTTTPLTSPTTSPTTTSTSPTIISLTPSPSTETSTPEPTPTPNPAGTNLTPDVASQNQPDSTVTIYANFDANDKFGTSATPGCELNARWPSNYGDIYFGEDRCLYDGSGSRIWDQCCTSSSSTSVQNPYRDPRPAASCERDWSPLFIKFRIWIKDWGVESELKKQIDGCGAITGWYWAEGNTDLKNDGSSNQVGQYRAQRYASFNIDIFFKAGCVGRAIASANGPPNVDC
ncbi:MAG: hypothetical protein M1840_004907 [Geoglossum simile]|nr:MAG: hypothetical protein M1840_004907 [Geoglossum simile]